MCVDCPHCKREEFFSIFESEGNPGEADFTEVTLKCHFHKDRANAPKYIAEIPQDIGPTIKYTPDAPDRCVHTEHCCSQHGCKYGDEDCPVEIGKKLQSFPCEDCGFDRVMGLD